MKVYTAEKNSLVYFIYCDFPTALIRFKELGCNRFKQSVFTDVNAEAVKEPGQLFWKRRNSWVLYKA